MSDLPTTVCFFPTERRLHIAVGHHDCPFILGTGQPRRNKRGAEIVVNGNRKLHTPGRYISGGADVLPLMPVGRFGLGRRERSDRNPGQNAPRSCAAGGHVALRRQPGILLETCIDDSRVGIQFVGRRWSRRVARATLTTGPGPTDPSRPTHGSSGDSPRSVSTTPPSRRPFQVVQRWTPKFGQVAKVGSRPQRRSLECPERDGTTRLS